ncbi:hydroxymethylglutaryl-CoA lyase [Oceanithermus desulfurans]|uniref:Hydroxymethylglutaryl-CoA lyase n=2 Tax=Oceanithermus desulfurans TaxID=227924 RepID=A0A511RH81_9DEIN|nr:hydroxymethylglutaryl-CoA lyase [Oceanithermus desulfurans]MBB6028940.1 hydroxymethylglutaryl-CoA lyase [Oceanithermus desulfurans]GEM88998.1 hydroxymethylglutaryl-CoA lyase [Oceanithermus desulfurans NBRC 100063]
MAEPVTYVECPRDAWQGFGRTIPTAEKAAFLRRLLDAGFDHLDLASFVSPKWVPQMADSEEVLRLLPPPAGRDYLAIVANERGMERALAAENLTSVGYPFSISETFQQKNTRRSIEDSWPLVERMLELARGGGLELVVYVSMGFGNPYGDPWSAEMVVDFVGRLRALGVRRIAIADTYGVAGPERIHEVLAAVAAAHGAAGLGAHLHSRPDPDEVRAKVDAVLEAGVRWLEGALGGIGGCPFAGDELVGNLPTEAVLLYLAERGFTTGVDTGALDRLSREANRLRTRYAG